MTVPGVRWTADQVLALAPDPASRAAGSRLGVAGPWSGTGWSEEGVVWGRCEGSGSAEYRTAVEPAEADGPAYLCECPSPRVPCKHALGLLLLWAGAGGAVPRGEVPEWAARWRAARRERARGKRTGGAAGSAPRGADPAAARRRAERRAGRIDQGAAELERRLTDLLRGGLAGARRAGYGMWEETAARMVDAQAPGLAARVRELGAIPGSGPEWPGKLLEECALLHLLGRGWLGRERLPPELAAVVRTRVGLTAPPGGPPLRDRWLVLARYDTADPRLTTRRTWLYGTASHRTALLLSYGAAGRAPEPDLPVGLALDAEVSAYDGAGGQRVALGERFAPPVPDPARPPGVTVTRAAARYGEAVRADPWLESVAVTLKAVVPQPAGETWQVADAAEDTALPLTARARDRPGLWRLAAVSGGRPVRVFGECGHRGFTPLAVWPDGPGPVVPLC
ncbi:SWIM zinc finger family protein [Streptomyces tagetis]|uniref:SWIM zinc finger family protein n=1 Tax=Streptomyces tagetis TaxID=2820809 RepID=A0A940XHQ6_9ACTN|nr:SWIM zinc finger family protein [Streptomyces sp. RG38]MBQ0828600.1 SWIM zinc finger family protein [Streptomyces sp. RG38]